MLPAHPLPVTSIFINTLKTCKSKFIPLLPITAISFITVLMVDLFSLNVPGSVKIAASIVLFLLDAFYFYWGVCFVYDLMILQKTSYLGSFKIVLKRFLRAFFLPMAVLTLAALVLVLFVGLLYVSSKLYIVKWGFLVLCAIASILFVFMVLSILIFNIIYPLEVLAHNTKISSAATKAAKISLKGDSLKRAFYICILLMLVGILIFIPYGVIGYLSKGAEVGVMTVSAMIMADVMVLIVFPLRVFLAIYFYNDLILRFKD